MTIDDDIAADPAAGSTWYCVLSADFHMLYLGPDEAEAKRHNTPGTYTQSATHRGAALTAAALLVAESQAR